MKCYVSINRKINEKNCQDKLGCELFDVILTNPHTCN